MSESNHNQHPSRFIVGIDLGTTNSALTYFDTLDPEKGLQILLVKQWHSPEFLVETELLPSFCYALSKNEIKNTKFVSPEISSTSNDEWIVGSFAKEFSFQNSQRVIHSAKSWLGQRNINPIEKILPWHSDEIIGNKRLSPIEVSTKIIEHLKHSWNKKIADHSEQYSLEFQQVIITVPASFNDSAQRHTIQAALLAGLKRENIKLIEEPQAAFYYWTEKFLTQEVKEQFLANQQKQQSVLICDIGGGTTDFSLFRMSFHGSSPEIFREKVGEHLLLGGDNIDLQIAHVIEKKLNTNLTSSQWNQLISQCRQLKENILSKQNIDENQDYFITVTSSQSGNLFNNVLSTSIKYKDLYEIILNGFFPICSKDAEPAVKQDGLIELGLEYPVDSSITKHLAQFVKDETIDNILFVGGSLKPQFIQDHICKIVSNWQTTPVKKLELDTLDLAVSFGATVFGKSQRQKTLQFKGGYPRSLYIAVESNQQKKLINIVPKGFDHQQSLHLDQMNLKARTNELVQFQIYSSNKVHLPFGSLVDDNVSDFVPLPKLQTTLTTPKNLHQNALIEIGLNVAIENTGLLSITCFSKSHPDLQWTLHFDTEHQSKQNWNSKVSELPHVTDFKVIEDAIETIFGKKKMIESLQIPTQLVKYIEKQLNEDKHQWSVTTLRKTAEFLLENANRRTRSANHEMVWYNLLGYTLRPGFGFEKDEYYLKKLWEVFLQGIAQSGEAKIRDQWWIMLRRVAGGFNQEQQNKIFTKVLPLIKNSKELTPEILLLAGSLERISIESKIQLGNYLIEQIIAEKPSYLEQKIWALGRVMSRTPFYAGPQSIIRPVVIEKWLNSIFHLDISKKQWTPLTQLYIQAGRLVQNREFDLTQNMREILTKKLQKTSLESHKYRCILELEPVSFATKEVLFGESLPIGLII